MSAEPDLIGRRPPALHTQFVDLLLIQLSNWRWSWPGMLVTGMITPLLGVLGLGLFASDRGPTVLGFVLTGNIVLALLFENLNKVAINFAFMRETGALDFFASLPVRRSLLVLASLTAFLALSLPALLVTTLVGSTVLGLALDPSLWLVLIVPLCTVPMAAIGALIGTVSSSMASTGSQALVVTVLMTGLGSVVVPPELLSDVLLALGWANPASYAASALRQALLGPVGPRLLLDLAVLLAFSVVACLLVSRVMRWRER